MCVYVFMCVYVCIIMLVVFDVRLVVERNSAWDCHPWAQVHLRTLRSRSCPLVDLRLLRGPLVDPPPSTPSVATGGPSTPWGPRVDQLLQGRSTGGFSTTKGRSAGGSAIPVGCPLGVSSTPEVVFWWASHSRGGPLVGTQLQRWCTGGPSTLRDDIWGWRPSLWFYVCAYAYDIYIYMYMYVYIHIYTYTYTGVRI